MVQPARFFTVSLLVILLSGCVESPAPTPPTPAELLKSVEESRESAQTTHEMLRKDSQPFRLKVLKSRAVEGIDLADQLVAHPEATSEQLSVAYAAKVDLLFLAASNFPDEFMDDFKAYAKKMVADGMPEEARQLAASRWLWVKYSSNDAPLDEAETAIIKFAKAYPSSDDAAVLLFRHCERLIVQGEFKKAKKVLKRSEKILTDKESLSSANVLLAKSLRAAKNKARKHANAAHYRSMVRSKLGGRETGHFVVHSVAKAGKKFCDYSVCDGIDNVIVYAEKADLKGWEWSLIQRFPATQAGYAGAKKKRKHLYDTTTRVGFY